MQHTDRRVRAIIKTFTADELETMYRKRQEPKLFFYVGFAALSPEDRKSSNVKVLAQAKGYEVLMKAHGRNVPHIFGDVFETMDELIGELEERFRRWFCDRCGELVKGEVRKHRGEAICTDCFFGR
jgi:formylmethanofuran dehydrogenase subunit E